MTTIQLPVATERLVLRGFTPDDLDGLYAYQRLPEVARYLYRPPFTREQCERSLARRAAGTAWAEDGDNLVVAVCRAEDAVLVGEVVLKLANVGAHGITTRPVCWNRPTSIRGPGTGATRPNRSPQRPASPAHNLPARPATLRAGCSHGEVRGQRE
ncbi:GNAT family N-acetyltransferase [Streptomyces sp. NPDC021356]|uniref:GNAT family N-acetyltransferase n=1 Tax=Streptomyces sp. NPDC021356 TaxID=3154900 RepID=UPI003401885F